MAMRIRDIMTEEVMTIHMDNTLLTAHTLFKQLGFHHLLVVEDRKLMGVLSDRDMLRWIGPHLDTPAETRADLERMRKPVHQLMTRELVTVSQDTPVTYAGNLMLEQRVSCLPVVNDRGHPVGIVSWRDLLSAHVMLQDV